MLLFFSMSLGYCNVDKRGFSTHPRKRGYSPYTEQEQPNWLPTQTLEFLRSKSGKYGEKWHGFHCNRKYHI